MITGELKTKVDEIWNAFHSNGITDPLTTIQQITYLLFIRRLDEEQLRMEKQANRTGKPIDKPIYTPEQKEIRWHHFKELEPKQMLDVFTKATEERPVTAFEFIKMVGGEQSQISRFFKDSTFVLSSAYLLDKAVQMIDKIDMQDRDTKGDLYEYLLSKLTQAGRAGQFRTPRHIIRMMVDMVKPTPEDTICDPSAGTSGFLVSAGEYLRDTYPDKFLEQEFSQFFNNEMFTGIEFDQNMMRVGAMNLILHGVEHPNLMHVNALSDENEVSDNFSLMLANPPFKGTLDYDLVSSSVLSIAKTKKTELLFLSLMLRMMRVGGRCAVIVPDGVLFGSSGAHKAIRSEIIEKHKLEAVISMPSGVFKPYAGVSTAVLLFTKTNSGGTDKVWFYKMEADGFTLDDKRTKTDKNDIPDILKRWDNPEQEEERKRTEKSFFVPFKEIKENDWDLSINRYKEIEYEEVEYDAPEVIIEQIKDLQRQNMNDLEALEALLK